MSLNTMKRMTLLFSIILSLLIPRVVPAEENLIELEFGEPPASDTAGSKSPLVLVTVRDISEVYSTGGLYLMTHEGDREELFQKENQGLIENPSITQPWRFCSVFSAKAEGEVVVGRNWDNQNVGSIIVSLYHPPNGYSSVSFSRAIDMGFPLNVRLEEMAQSPFGAKLLLAPFYAMDGINEHGLTIALAGLRQTTHEEQHGREPVFITFLIRKILDQAKNVQEAVELAEKYVPFDLDQNSLSGHMIITDSSGGSVILEYGEDQWSKTYGGKSWQVLTTTPIHNVADETLRESCWRYRAISETLDKTGGNIDWRDGIDILRSVEQKGTTWSVIYSPSKKDIYFCVYQDWGRIYHLQMPLSEHPEARKRGETK